MAEYDVLMFTLFKRKGLPLQPWFAGLVQSLAIALYIVTGVAIGTSDFFVSTFGMIDVPLAPIVFLFLFCFSVLVCGCITLLYPVYVYQKKGFRSAISVLLWMAVWMLVGLLLIAVALWGA